MTRKDWNLIVLAAAGGRPLTPAQYQKCLFILQRKFPDAVADGYDFRPYNYGPFDPQVFADGEALEREGLATTARAAGGWKTYAATVEGVARAARLAGEPPSEPAEYASRLVEWARGLSFEELVESVCAAFPDTATARIFG